MSGKKAVITGITGQDGAYLAELLITEMVEADLRLTVGQSNRGGA